VFERGQDLVVNLGDAGFKSSRDSPSKLTTLANMRHVKVRYPADRLAPVPT